mmetsp:Transcript_24806/g.30491  ORF Transcript_24806/g.30491 Transcript_24806/m.30491 type:complete len:362 (+) Transcript_24806:178-1263(+)
MTFQEQEAITSIQRSLTLLTLSEQDKNVIEFVFNREWNAVRDSITKQGADLSLKLVCSICSVGPPQSVLVAMKRASSSRIFAEIDEKGRHPLHYLCYHGAPTYAIVYAAQCYIAALEQSDDSRKTPLEYLMTMPWEYHQEDRDEVILELQKMHKMKCYDERSKLPNQLALEKWGHKVVLEEKIKCFLVCFIECARTEHAPDFDGCCLSHIAAEIRDKCHDVVDEIKQGGNLIRADAYRLQSNQFALVVKTQSKEDCEAAYKTLCLNHLGSFKHCGIYLMLGCVYCQGIIGSKSLSEMVREAEEVQNKVKEDLESAAFAVSAALNDVYGERKINVSPMKESHLKDFAAKEYIPDKCVSSFSK